MAEVISKDRGNNTIWKYQFETLGETEFEIPAYANIVHVGAQHFNYMDKAPRSYVSIWACVNPDANKIKRKFRVVATGEDLSSVIDSSDAVIHIGTAIFENNTVWHVLEIV